LYHLQPVQNQSPIFFVIHVLLMVTEKFRFLNNGTVSCEGACLVNLAIHDFIPCLIPQITDYVRYIRFLYSDFQPSFSIFLLKVSFEIGQELLQE